MVLDLPIRVTPPPPTNHSEEICVRPQFRRPDIFLSGLTREPIVVNVHKSYQTAKEKKENIYFCVHIYADEMVLAL